MSLLSLKLCRPAGGESNDTGVLPRWSVLCRNSRSPFPLSNGRQRDGVHYSHNKAHKRHDLDQIPHGPARIAGPLSLLQQHLATSNATSVRNPSAAGFNICQCSAGVPLMSVLLTTATGSLKVPSGVFSAANTSHDYFQCR